MLARDFREVLNAHYASRRARNPKYSLRAFARDVGISPSRLSEVLTAGQRLSRLSAGKVAERLGLSPYERELFCDMADAEHPSNEAVRASARDRLKRHWAEAARHWTLLRDETEIVASWHYFAILELIAEEGEPHGESDVAHRLGLPTTKVRESLQRLRRLGLARKVDGHWRRTAKNVATSHDVPSSAIRAWHRQILEKAQEAIEGQEFHKRSLNAVYVTLPEDEVPRVMAKLHEFCRDFGGAPPAKMGGKRQVYCLAVQFFALTR